MARRDTNSRILTDGHRAGCKRERYPFHCSCDYSRRMRESKRCDFLAETIVHPDGAA